MTSKKTTEKILFVITKSNWGGAQSYVYTLATHTKERYETAVVLGGEGILRQKLENEKIRVIPVSSLSRDVNLIRDLQTFAHLYRVFKEERPGIVHLNSSKIGGIGALAARCAKVPKIIFTAHGWAFNEKRIWLSKKIVGVLHWLTIILSHKTILVSRALARDIKRAPFIKTKITVVHNGIETFSLKPKDEARKSLAVRLGLSIEVATSSESPEKILWFGTIAELHNNKGLSYALTAMQKLKVVRPDVRFFFLVLGEGEERTNLENLIQELNLQENVFLAGHVENAASFLPAFDVFLSSSITEALAFVILEAGLAGIPVIASGVGGIPEIIDDMESGILVRPKSPDEIVKALDFLISHPKESARFAKKLQANVKKNFSLKKMLRETLAVYRSAD